MLKPYLDYYVGDVPTEKLHQYIREDVCNFFSEKGYFFDEYDEVTIDLIMIPMKMMYICYIYTPFLDKFCEEIEISCFEKVGSASSKIKHLIIDLLIGKEEFYKIN